MRPGCRAMGVELEGAVVVAEVEQVREPSSEGQDLMAGSVEASVQSRLPLCGEPRFGFGSPGLSTDILAQGHVHVYPEAPPKTVLC